MLLENLPAKWDMEADVVSLGSGIGGLSAAITAHDNGAKAMVLERADQVGGVTALSLGEVWIAGNHLADADGIEDSSDSGYRYLKRLGMDYGDDVQMLNFAVHARVALKYFADKAGLKMHYIKDCPDYYYGTTNDGIKEGRLLEVDPFPAATLGEWQPKTRVSPHVPWGMTHHDIFAGGGFATMKHWDFNLMGERLTKDERCLGSGLAAYFVKAVLDRKIPMETGMNVEELIADGKRVVGVRATRNGKNIFIKANKGVVVAVSSHDRNPKMNKQLIPSLHLETMVFPTIDGANFRLAGAVGARIAKVPEITQLGVHVPGEEQENGEKLWRSAIQMIGLPHHIAVNRTGKRFANEAFYRSICFAVDVIDGGTQTHPNFPCWAILDSQAREKYPCGSVMPEQEMPEGFGVKANTIAELAEKAGIDAKGLEATIAAFNKYAEKGEDPEFKRGSHVWSAWMCGDPTNKPHPNLGSIAKPPFYAIEMHRLAGNGIPATGLATDRHSRVLGWDDKPIEGLYAAGNSVARMETGANMQSGVSNGRGMTYGYLAGMHASGKPSTLLEGEIKRMGL